MAVLTGRWDEGQWGRDAKGMLWIANRDGGKIPIDEDEVFQVSEKDGCLLITFWETERKK